MVTRRVAKEERLRERRVRDEVEGVKVGGGWRWRREAMADCDTPDRYPTTNQTRGGCLSV